MSSPIDTISSILPVAWGNLRQRYASMSGGLFWLLLKPALLAGVFTAVFGGLFAGPANPGGPGSRFSYLAYLLAGLVPWVITDEAIRTGGRVYLSNGALLKSQKSSGELLCAVSAFEGIFVLTGALIVLWGIYTTAFRAPALSDLWLPVLLGLLLVTLWGVVLCLSLILTVIRDTEPLLDPFMTILFWTAPVAYRADILPAALKTFTLWWPPAVWVRLWRTVLADGRMPDLCDLELAVIAAALFVVTGIFLTRKRFHLVADAV